MRKGVRVAAALVICPLILAGCGIGARSDGLPTPPGDVRCPIADNGPLAPLKLHGPACRDVKEFQFWEAGRDTVVDLEPSPAGGTADLAYDHFTGELKPIYGAMVSSYDKDNGWPGPLGNEPSNRGDYPGEQECQGRSPGLNSFDKDYLGANFSIYCIKTAEGHDGFLRVDQIPEQKPVAYHVYSFIWDR